MADELQDHGMMLSDAEQNAMRMQMGLRAMRAATRRGNLTETDLNVLEIMLARWWRAWSPAMPGTAESYGVQITIDTVAEICGLSLTNAAASMQRLADSGLILPSMAPWDLDDNDGPTVQMAGVFAPVLEELEPVLFRNFVDHHKGELRKWARAYLDTIAEEVEYAEELRSDHVDTASLVRDWNAFKAAPQCSELLEHWERDPKVVYAWFDALSVLQERASMIAGYPSKMGSVRQQLGEMLPERIAVMTDKYRSAD